MEELKCSFAPHRMATVKIFYFSFVALIELVVEKPDLTEFITDPGIRLYQIVMTAFNHKWSWKYQVGHLRITECIPHIEVGHFPFKCIHETAFVMRVSHFFCPVAKVTRTYREAIA